MLAAPLTGAAVGALVGGLGSAAAVGSAGIDHAFIREVELTEEEWWQAVQFLTQVGQKCDDRRQEFVLLSDTLGASMLVFAGIAFAASPVMVGTKLDAMQDHVTGSHGKGSFTADMRAMKSEQSTRDRTFQRRIMDTSSYPIATFALTKPIEIGSLPASGVARKYSATGNLTLRGTTKAVTIPISADHAGTTIRVLGRLPIVFADWNIANPSFPPLVTTKDQGELEFLLNFTKGATSPEASTTTTEAEPPPGGPPPGGFTQPTVTPTTLAPLEIPR